MDGCALAAWDEFQEDRKRKIEKDTCAHPPCLGGEVNMATLLSAFNKWAVGADF